jgi:hypothetical protein
VVHLGREVVVDSLGIATGNAAMIIDVVRQLDDTGSIAIIGMRDSLIQITVDDGREEATGRQLIGAEPFQSFQRVSRDDGVIEAIRHVFSFSYRDLMMEPTGQII